MNLAILIAVHFLALAYCFQPGQSECVTDEVQYFAFNPFPSCGQSQCVSDEVHYFAFNLQMKYEVVRNYPSALMRLDWTNSGAQVISGGPWNVYFSSMPPISGVRPNGVLLGNSGLRAYHVNGILYRLEPTAAFNPIQPGVTLQIDLPLNFGEASRYSIMPNWYVVSTGDDCDDAEVIQSTAGESLDFVSPFLRPEQWKRGASDTYDPYSPEFRYDLDNWADLGAFQHTVIPTPLEELWDNNRHVDLTESWVLVEPVGELMSEARYLADALQVPIVPIAQAPPTKRILLNIGDTQLTSPESYTLIIDADFELINITGLTSAGVFHAGNSLISLTYPASIVRHGYIRDGPRYEYRGVHLDVSRNFQTAEDVIDLIPSMARYKINKLHLHLTDDEGWRLEIPEIPELTEVGANRCHDPSKDRCIIPQLGSDPKLPNAGSGYYSVQQYQEIVRVAAQHHIEVIPEFDMPGHCHAAINAMLYRYRKYNETDMEKATEFLLTDLDDTSDYISIQYFTDNAIDPCVESSYHFIEVLINSVKQIHAGTPQPLKIFHLGGDEVPPNAWSQSPSCQRDYPGWNQGQLKQLFIRRAVSLITEAGLDSAAWEDGLYPPGSSLPFDRESLDGENVYATVWDNVWEWGVGNRANVLANNDYKVIIAHATHLYFDHPQEPDPEERGLFWATRLSSLKKVFGFIPDNIYENMGVDGNGRPIDRNFICNTYGCPPLEPGKRANVAGIQSQAWAEEIRTIDQLHYMEYPRLIALAERGWHKAAWEDLTNEAERNEALNRDYTNFVNTLGYRELRRLDEISIKYRIPLPGVKISNTNVMSVNSGIPGLPMFYSLDGGQTWSRVTGDLQLSPGNTVQTLIRSFDQTRSSRVVQVAV